MFDTSETEQANNINTKAEIRAIFFIEYLVTMMINDFPELIIFKSGQFFLV